MFTRHRGSEFSQTEKSKRNLQSKMVDLSATKYAKYGSAMKNRESPLMIKKAKLNLSFA
jgi:hypothetical protein